MLRCTYKGCRTVITLACFPGLKRDRNTVNTCVLKKKNGSTAGHVALALTNEYSSAPYAPVPSLPPWNACGRYVLQMAPVHVCRVSRVCYYMQCAFLASLFPACATTVSCVQGTKRRKTDKGAAETAVVPEQMPVAGFRGHAQAVTGLAGPEGAGGRTTVFSASLDRAVKTWDAERQDCVHTLNAPKAVTCLGCSSSGR